jgi:putative Holliday junction resolvase
MQKILGVDVGLKKSGLAVNYGELVEPLKLIRHSSNRQLVNKLETICQQNKIEKIILGLPEGKLVPVIKSLKKKLETKLDIPIVLHDETLTSQTAVKEMVKTGKPRKYRQKGEDLFAAALILEDYLEQYS